MDGGGRKLLWGVLGAAVVIAVVVGVFWLGRGTGPQQPPPEPTPTAAEIAASRQAQDDRLRELTQAMVAEMMAEREEEIRQELIARQTRIVELQLRLQQSERRAAQGAAAAASEAETQKKLMAEIEEQEKAQREQEDALETERQEAMNEAAQQASAETVAIGGGAVSDGEPDPSLAKRSGDPDRRESSRRSRRPSRPRRRLDRPPRRSRAPVEYGEFVKPEDVDTRPVVVKSQSLVWPRNAQRSNEKGVVVVQLTVNPTGGVDEVVVIRADHTGWGIPEAAVEAASGLSLQTRDQGRGGRSRPTRSSPGATTSPRSEERSRRMNEAERDARPRQSSPTAYPSRTRSELSDWAVRAGCGLTSRRVREGSCRA